MKLNDLEININSEEAVNEVYNIIVNELEPIIDKEKNELKKTLLRTNRLFMGV